MPAQRSINIFKGDSRRIWRRWKSGGKPVDLTGATIDLILEDTLRGNQLYLASTANGKLDSPGADGVISGEIPPASPVPMRWPIQALAVVAAAMPATAARAAPVLSLFDI